ncbi:helix-turn-helix domain-containing protein [Mycolicibacter virginiensis]|uniref:helix-turn-helix domain-containing protein n=1 Tax=Mycolicibacter virginiensis TaxID=1795032 RepID=UPI001F049034|nr:helix-turn-helix domain-containing protein [Mycolicibacter virginiensis]ULP45927.1 helix-turn-helix domain-containing protein [Mycolicibacter virginiensis]
MEKQRGIPGRFFAYRIPDTDGRRAVARRVQAGEPIDEIAAELGISTSTVRRYSFEFAGEFAEAGVGR